MCRKFMLLIAILATLAVGYSRDFVGDPLKDFSDFKIEDINFSSLGDDDTIYKFNFNIYKDKGSLVFLSRKFWGGRGGNVWIVYVPVKGGYARITETTDHQYIAFRPDGWYFVGKVAGYFEKRGLYVVYPGKGGGDLGRYDFQDGTATFHQLRSLEWGNPEDIKLVETVLGHKLGDPKFIDPTYEVLSASAIRAGAASH